jgi:hypothetical protein
MTQGARSIPYCGFGLVVAGGIAGDVLAGGGVGAVLAGGFVPAGAL